LEFQGLIFDWATDARNFVNEFMASERYDSTQYYKGKLPDVDIDTAQEDRSRAVLTEVGDTVLGMMPLMRIFFSGDGVVEFKPVGSADPEEFKRREEQAAQATQYFREVVLMADNPDSFLSFHDVFQDALVRKTGFMRWQWERTRKPIYSTHTGLTEREALQLIADPDVTIVAKQTYTAQLPAPLIPPAPMAGAGAGPMPPPQPMRE
jgi:hypothetical protein